MHFFGFVLTPKDVDSCVKLYRQHSETICQRCGIETSFEVERTLHLTMAALDIDYGAFIRRELSSMNFGSEKPLFVVNNRQKFTLKIKRFKGDNGVIICHLHEANKYQTPIDLYLASGSTVVFTCQQTCSIHLTGYYLNTDRE